MAAACTIPWPWCKGVELILAARRQGNSKQQHLAAKVHSSHSPGAFLLIRCCRSQKPNMESHVLLMLKRRESSQVVVQARLAMLHEWCACMQVQHQLHECTCRAGAF